MEISSLWRRFRPCSKRQYFPLLESSVDCRIYPNLPYLCISYSPWQYWSTYYIPLPQQLASFAWYFHVVEGISQSQTLEYRFGRYLPVLFAHAHKILQSCLTVYQIYSDNFSSIILHSNDFYANIHQLFWNNQFFSEIYHISMRCPRLLHNHYVYVRLFHSAIFHFHAFFIILLALAGWWLSKCDANYSWIFSASSVTISALPNAMADLNCRVKLPSFGPTVGAQRVTAERQTSGWVLITSSFLPSKAPWKYQFTSSSDTSERGKP